MFQHSTFSSIVIAASICSIATMSSLTLAQGAARAEPTEAVQSTTIEIAYDPDTTAEVTPTQRARAQTILDATYAAAATLLSDLPDHVNVTIALLDRDLRSVGDVTGRADAPGAITIQISSQAEGGIDGAIEHRALKRPSRTSSTTSHAAGPSRAIDLAPAFPLLLSTKASRWFSPKS